MSGYLLASLWLSEMLDPLSTFGKCLWNVWKWKFPKMSSNAFPCRLPHIWQAGHAETSAVNPFQAEKQRTVSCTPVFLARRKNGRGQTRKRQAGIGKAQRWASPSGWRGTPVADKINKQVKWKMSSSWAELRTGPGCWCTPGIPVFETQEFYSYLLGTACHAPRFLLLLKILPSFSHHSFWF